MLPVDAHARTPFPRWASDLPAIPVCTRLYHLEPLGIGTPWTESLTGYIARLAEAHCVRVSTLVAREIGPLVTERGGVAAFAQHNWTHFSRAINGVGRTAQVLVDALHSLTGRRDLHFLTLLTWGDVLPPAGLLRREKAWCPICYQNWRDNGQVVYEPLLWSVSAVTGCPRHGDDLRTRCPTCQKGQYPLAVAARPGYCPHCGSWLGRPPAPVDRGPPGPSYVLSPWAQWAAASVGELIGAAPAVAAPPTKEHLAPAIARCTGDDPQRELQEVAHAAHISYPHLWAWRRGLKTPSLPLLLRLCGSLGLSPLHLLVPSLRPIDGQPPRTPPVIPPAKRTKRPSTGDDHAMIRRAVAELLHRDASSSLSLRSVADAVGHTETTLRRVCPELCAAIVERWRAQRRARTRERNLFAATSVRQAILRVHAAGLPPTAKRVKAFLPPQVHLRTAVAQRTWRDTRRELGLEA